MSDGFRDDLLTARSLEEPSGFQSTMRYRLAEWTDGRAVVVMEIGPQHLNRRKVVHGGVLASLIDTACGFSGGYAETPGEQPAVATVTLTTSFLAPAVKGPLRAVGARSGGGRRIYFARAEIFDGDGTLVAHGEGSFRVSERRVRPA
ncbi:PaaI family thioesterase [Lutibaculum baratangense]|uniref:Thioesterase domain-containing protein n=1 Tax=Lutibaculum baratangense AMV1 TaxID=631454 RepID=V4RD89_9HYPH|nr:PaaI family thioesterase [Lutibaculum baratangense]ESR23354.1 hypothetical protein N177_3422 [Lutibaculum baratangense AMV1]